ncbi:MAG: hypothetical protein V2B14_07170 [bacterium]
MLMFSSSVMLIVGSVVLLKSMSLEPDAVIHALKLSSIGAIISGFFGFFIGKIFETSNPKKEETEKNKKDSDLLIDDLLINDLDNIDNE